MELTQEVDQGKRAALLVQLVDKFERVDEVHNKILSAMLDDEEVEGDAYQTEFDASEVYRERFLSLKVELGKGDTMASSDHEDAFSSAVFGPGSVVSSKSGNRRRFKLPTVQLKLFSGDAKEWMAWWGQFKQIHDDDEIVVEDKYQYLSQSMVPGSKAARVVERFPPSTESYKQAVPYLKSRFAKDELLIQIYVRQLLGMVMENALSGKTCKDVVGWYDRLDTNLRALGTLGRTQDKFADFLYPLVESCLPDAVLRAWERNRTREKLHGKNTANLLSRLMDFLGREVESEVGVIAGSDTRHTAASPSYSF